MTDLVVRAVMTGDHTGLVGAARAAATELENLRAAAGRVQAAGRLTVQGYLEERRAAGETAQAVQTLTGSTMALERALFQLGGGVGYQVSQLRQLTLGISALAREIGPARLAVGALGGALAYGASQTTLFQLAWRRAREGLGEVWDYLIAKARELDEALARALPGTMRMLGAPRARAEEAGIPFDMPRILSEPAIITPSPLLDALRRMDREAAERQAFADRMRRSEQDFLASLIGRARGGTTLLRFPDRGITLQDRSVEINAIREFHREAERLWDEFHLREIERAQEQADAIIASYAYMADGIRQQFAMMGAAAVLNFDRMGEAAARFAEQLANIALQRTVMGPLADVLFGPAGTVLGGAVGGWLSGILGLTPPPLPAPASATTAPAVLNPFGFYHAGGVVGDVLRAHAGWLAPDEEAVIVQRGEGIFTPRQMQNADAILRAALSQRVSVNIYEAPGAQARVEERRGPDGALALDVVIEEVEARLADRIDRGRSVLSRRLETAYGMRRRPT